MGQDFLAIQGGGLTCMLTWFLPPTEKFLSFPGVILAPPPAPRGVFFITIEKIAQGGKKIN